MATLEELEAQVVALREELADALEVVMHHASRHAVEGADAVLPEPQIKDTTGAPTHSAPEGTPLWNTVDNTLYVNNDGTTGWTLVGP